MDLKEINSKLKEVDISLNTADIGNDSEIMEVSAPTDVEGLYKLVKIRILTISQKNLYGPNL